MPVATQTPFDQAMDGIRRRLRNGAHAPDEALIIIDLARALKLSPTPVREALARLAGEGLVEDRGRGYIAPRLGPEDLAELYELHAVYVAEGLRAREAAEPGRTSPTWGPAALEGFLASASDPGLGVRRFAEALFAEIVAASENQTLMAAHRRLADRLARARRAEAQVFDDLVAEFAELADLHERGDVHSLRNALQAHDLKRRRAIKSIARRIGAPAPNISKI
jgi:DNA-binding GntR family transcriptional regulator